MSTLPTTTTSTSSGSRAGTVDAVKARVDQRVDEVAPRLLALSHEIHAHPELAFAEHRAAGLLADELERHGFTTLVGAYGLETSVEATVGTGDLRVVVCAEYDALPDIGHACGHNIIATVGLGAAIALADVADELGLTVVLLGTPAEEHGGGKVLLLAAGAWDGAAMSLMVHPMSGTDVSCRGFSTQAVDRFRVRFTGAAAHAAAAPERGVNAADAVTVAQTGIGLLRQHLASEVRMAAFVAHGGEATNIVPAATVVEAEVRATSLTILDDARARMLACFEAGAVATGCTWSTEPTEPRYESLVQDPVLADLWDQNLRAGGREVAVGPGATGASTDMGNVSQVVPSIHPAIALLGETDVPHTVGFAASAVTPAGDRAVVDAARALARTVVDATSDPTVRADLLARLAQRDGTGPAR